MKKCKACFGTGLAPRGWLCSQCHGHCFTKAELHNAFGPKLSHEQYLKSLERQHATKHPTD